MTAAKEIERYLKEAYGMDLATHEQMSNEDTDYTSVALNAKNAGTDCVIYWGLNQANGQLCYTAMHQYCGDDIFFAGGTNLAQNQMLTTWSAQDIDGVVFRLVISRIRRTSCSLGLRRSILATSLPATL